MTSQRCPECDAKIPVDAPEGLCRRCVLLAGMTEDLAPPTLRVRCPHCRHAIEVLGETRFTNVSCPRCDSRFDLVADETLEIPGTAPEKFGRFDLLGMVGKGGFGAVWRCRDPELDRIVALKLPRKEQVGGESEQFLREARAAAQLRHPNIVTIHEVGREDDRVYIVSDLIEGVDLATRLRETRFSYREAAELAARIADALQHAHESGIVHRDMKPSNVLIDAEGEPHLTDFGLAKRDADEITITVDGTIVGTPAYMSPEQASGRASAADGRTDIYSLGVVLFEMLTGEKPFRGDSQMLLYQVVHEEAPGPRRLDASVPRDLDVICLKCLEKEPRRRYETAHDLAEDLRRFLRDEPIQARRVTRFERSWRWGRRNPLLATLAGALAMALVIGLAAVSWQWLRAEAEVAANRRLLYAADVNVALDAWRDGRLERVLPFLERHRPRRGESDLRGFEWFHLHDQTRQAGTPKSLRTKGPVVDLDFSPGGETFAVASVILDNLSLWDTRTAVKTATLLEPAEGVTVTHDVEFAPRGDVVAFCGSDGVVRLWDPVARKELRLLRGHEGRVSSLSFSPDGSRLASGGWDHTVRVWDVHTGECETILEPQQGRVNAVRYSPDGRFLATAGSDSTIALFDVMDGYKAPVVLDRHQSAVESLAFSPNGALLASGGDDHSILLWEPSSGELLAVLRGHTQLVEKVAFAPDGQTLASAGRDNTVRLWDVSSRQLVRTLRGHSAAVMGLAFSPDGKTLASGCSGATVKLWTLDRTATVNYLRGHKGLIWSIVFSPAGGLLASGCGDGVLRLFDLETGEVVRSLDGHGDRVQSVGFSGDGNVLASGGFDGTVRLWDVRTGTEVLKLRLEDPRDKIWTLAISADGQLLGTLATSGLVQLWSTVSGSLLRTLGERPPFSRGLALAPDGKVLAAGRGNEIDLWDVSSGELLGSLAGELGHHDAVSTIAFSPDGRTIASGGQDATVILWDVPTRSVRATCRGHASWIWCVAFSPDGKRVASSSMDKTIMLWDTASGEDRGMLFQSHWSVMSVAFSADGTILAAPDGLETVRLFHASLED